jgi:hypothetical protein
MHFLSSHTVCKHFKFFVHLTEGSFKQNIDKILLSVTAV